LSIRINRGFHPFSGGWLLDLLKKTAHKNKPAIMFTQIQINDFSKSIFIQVTKKEVNQLKSATSSFVVNTTVFNQLLSRNDYPINKKLAIINILEFLEYLDQKIIDSYDGRVEIPKNVFEKHFTSHHYLDYQEILYSLSIIKVTLHDDGTLYTANWKEKTPKGEQQPEAKCKIFKVGFDYLNNNTLSLVIPVQKKAVIKIDNQIKGMDKRFIKTIKTVEINLLPALEDEIDEYRRGDIKFNQLKNRLHRIFQLKRIKYIKKGKKVDRIFHSLSNISRVSRKHLTIPFHNIDVKNCQPLLLCCLMVKDGHLYDDNYKNDCEKAVFYAQFKGFGPKKIDVKVLLYRHVFFGFKPHEKINQYFKELYPKTWEYLNNVAKLKKEKTKITLASKLQNLESELFNNLVPDKSKYFFTLFDAIYFDRLVDAAELKDKIENFFNDMGLVVLVELDGE
jgi:hypothetical protein